MNIEPLLRQDKEVSNARNFFSAREHELQKRLLRNNQELENAIKDFTYATHG